ncbi:hypothetical protein BS47DRAFT_1367890 [Hydnum rufescens UP504]|uniref:Uncharacterized protein n=1 Tax=Hydnum rufescens UP504 TaxID=1448309 RepID=A0A9P6AHZ1_9AGAM|nr:hypothetical protein BS47DRAFT_1367890 [Hydnum rufescens UP504]
MEAESKAFIAWLKTYGLSRPVRTVSDLSDGAALFDVLSVVDEEYFRHPTRGAIQASENWVLRLANLKRLFRLITQYFADVLHQPASALGIPDLQAIAEHQDIPQTLELCRLTLAIAVQGAQNKEVIERIQQLDEEDQRALMHAIEEVMEKVPKHVDAAREISMTDELSRVISDKEVLENVYQALILEHRDLQSNFPKANALSDTADLSARMQEVERKADEQRNNKTDSLLRGEIDRLQRELQKSEDHLGSTEADLDRHVSLITDLTKKVEDLQIQANQAIKLKDQVDEYKHAAEKVQKIENVMEKYKKKLEESADLRRIVKVKPYFSARSVLLNPQYTLKTLEEQNASLVDKNAALEEEYRKVSAFRPLMDSYKTQIAELENKAASKTKDFERIRFELEQAQTRLDVLAQERAQDIEALELYQERVKELELSDPRARSRARRNTAEGGPLGEMVDVDLAEDSNLGGELDDAVTGRTTTDLKLQIRQLKRDLQDARSDSADTTKALILENLLDDANRMKSRYEADYLATHREKLLLQSQLDDIRAGKSHGDGPEAAIALRQRLNEIIQQLDALREAHVLLQVDHENLTRELTVAKSDLNLVNKDQLDILASLRDSVNEDKAGLEEELQKMRLHIKEFREKNKMQLEQINELLMEKVHLQSDNIGQREKMLERERNFAYVLCSPLLFLIITLLARDLRASFSGKDLPEDTKAKFLTIHEENIQLKEQLQTSQKSY